MERTKNISSIPGMEDYVDYAVDVDGNIWSYKHNKCRKLKPGWAKKRGTYLYVRLSDRKGSNRNFYIHRLVAMAYLPCENFRMEVKHLNGNLCDNRIENLQWIRKKQVQELEQNFTLNDMLTDRVKDVYYASQRKGLKVSSSYDFINQIIDNALEEFINRYGLRKIIAQKKEGN